MTRRGRAHRKAAGRSAKYYGRQMHKRKPSWLDDWRFIWSNRTHYGARRSWVQKLLRW